MAFWVNQKPAGRRLGGNFPLLGFYAVVSGEGCALYPVTPGLEQKFLPKGDRIIYMNFHAGKQKDRTVGIQLFKGQAKVGEMMAGNFLQIPH